MKKEFLMRFRFPVSMILTLLLMRCIAPFLRQYSAPLGMIHFQGLTIDLFDGWVFLLMLGFNLDVALILERLIDRVWKD
jgi:hypothetical protein